MPYANNKGADQPAHLHSLTSTFVVRCLDGTICILAISQVSRFWLASVAEQAGLNLTWSKILEDTFLHDAAQSNKDPIKTKKAMLWTRSNMVFFSALNSSRTSNSEVISPFWSSKILWLSWLSVSLKIIRSKDKALSSGQHFLHYKSMGKLFITQGWVTPRRIVWSGPKSNSIKIIIMVILVKCKYHCPDDRL